MGMDYLGEVKRGKIKPYQLEMKIWKDKYNSKNEEWSSACKEASGIRLKFLEEKLKMKFDNIRKCYTDSSDGEKLTTGIEQKIGSAAVPLGIAGPLKVNGEFARGSFYLPVATCEAALVAGLNRGCRVINKTGGIEVKVTRDCMARSPLIETQSVEKAKEMVDRLTEKGELYKKVKTACEGESKVSKLVDIQPFQMGRYLHLRFVFQTGDSMGMNSATKYSAAGVRELVKNFLGVKLVSLTGNMCSDKKASHINVLFGRGKSVETEVAIPAKVIKDGFGVEAGDIVKLNYLKNYMGSSLGGTLTGFNANVANTIASMFVATGQDAAQIVESSSCFTRAEVVGDKLLFGLTLPCLEVATVGGGTGFGTARECLEILGCYGYGNPPGANAKKLAEILAAAASAQDLNLMGTECNQYELAESHIRLSRGK